jgi:hypothetical protein
MGTRALLENSGAQGPLPAASAGSGEGLRWTERSRATASGTSRGHASGGVLRSYCLVVMAVAGSVMLAAPSAAGVSDVVAAVGDDAPTTFGQRYLYGDPSQARAPMTAGGSPHFDLAGATPEQAAAVKVAQAGGAPGGGEAQEPAESAGSASALNQQLSNPVTSLWSLGFQFSNFYLENHRWNNTLQFQPVLPISLTKNWNLINRPVIPLYNSVPVPTASGTSQRTGFGDITLLELLSPANSGNWILGAGPTFIFPMASGNEFGQGKWQAGPAAVVGYMTKQFIVGVFPQHWWSIGDGTTRRFTSQTNLQPIASLFFGDGWSVGYSGNITANWMAPAGQVWTVPIGLGIGKVVKLGRLPVKIQLAMQYMPVRPNNGQEWNVQLQITPVIPKLVKGTIFE